MNGFCELIPFIAVLDILNIIKLNSENLIDIDIKCRYVIRAAISRV